MLHGGAPVPVDELLAHREWVRRMAGSLARDDAEADDLAQEAWVTALEHPPSHAASVRRAPPPPPNHPPPPRGAAVRAG